MEGSGAWMVLEIAIFVLFMNLPLGRLRVGVRKYSWRNFGCILAPVPIVVAIRLLAGIPIKVAPVFLVSAIVGQRLGMLTVRSFGKKNLTGGASE